MKRKRRSVASYRAASLKAARTRRKMKEARENEQTVAITVLDQSGNGHHLTGTITIETIDLIPKVEWRWP